MTTRGTYFDRRRFRLNAFANAIAVALGQLAQVGLFVVLARVLTTGEFAGFLAAAAMVGVGEMLSDFGARVWATQCFATKSSPGRTFHLAIVSKLLFSAAMAVIFLLLPVQSLGPLEVLMVVLIAAAQPSTDPSLWYLRSQERLDIEAAVLLGWRLWNVSVLALLAVGGFGLTYLLIAWLGNNLVRVAVAFALPRLGPLRRHLTEVDQGSIVADMFSVLRVVLPIGLAFATTTAFQRLGVLALELGHTSVDVALFGAAYTLVSSATFLAISVTAASFPGLSRALAADDDAAVSAIISRKLLVIAALFVPGCLIGVVLLPDVITLLYGEAYAAAGTVAVLLLPGLFLSAVNFGLKFFMNAARMSWTDTASGAAAIIVFLTVFATVPVESAAYRAALGWTAGELVGFAVRTAGIRVTHRLSLGYARWVLPCFAAIVAWSLLFYAG